MTVQAGSCLTWFVSDLKSGTAKNSCFFFTSLIFLPLYFLLRYKGIISDFIAVAILSNPLYTFFFYFTTVSITTLAINLKGDKTEMESSDNPL